MESLKRNIDKSNLYTEAARCLSCYDPPCQKACPASVPVPAFIRALLSGNTDYADEIVREANPMISTCGEVCPAEDYCMKVCTRNQLDRPVEIRLLHKFATDYGEFRGHKAVSDSGFNPELAGKKIAIVGAGPAGLSCAVSLKSAGASVTVYEKSGNLGGVPHNEIPESRLPRENLGDDLQAISSLDIRLEMDIEIGNPEQLLGSFDAVFLSSGLPTEKRLNVPGEDHIQVYRVLEFLRRAKSSPDQIRVGERVVVVGGGNVSLDAACAAYRLGAKEVHLLYRRGVKEMKVWESELREATELGVMIHYLTFPKEFMIKDSRLRAVLCGRNQLSDEIDASGRRKPIPLDGFDFTLPGDSAVVAIGLNPDGKMAKYISDRVEGYRSKVRAIFLGGDIATGEGTIVEAVRQGKEAAQAINAFLKDGQW